MENMLNFSKLVLDLTSIDGYFKAVTANAINTNHTIRNWLIGAYIIEFEQNGLERAQYATNLIQKIADELNQAGLSARNLRQFRQFYLTYSDLLALPNMHDSSVGNIWQSLPAKLHDNDIQGLMIWQTASAKLKSKNDVPKVPAEQIIHNLSYSHLVTIMAQDDPLKRTFYEIESIKGRWSVAQLKRQINTLLYERSAMSKDPGLLIKMVNDQLEYVPQSKEIIKDVFTFEFLGLNEKYMVHESVLERALLNHIEAFMLELGHGFCFEARQQKILIGDEYYFIDLVFYHRILKCHVIIDLKVEEFNYGNAGQINTYLNYYKDKVVRPDDNPPIGILFVTDKNKALVEYATSGMDQQLFKRKYLVELPDKEVLKKIIEKEIGII